MRSSDRLDVHESRAPRRTTTPPPSRPLLTPPHFFLPSPPVFFFLEFPTPPKKQKISRRCRDLFFLIKGATQRNALLLARPIGFRPFFPRFLRPARHVHDIGRGCAVLCGPAECVAPMGHAGRFRREDALFGKEVGGLAHSGVACRMYLIFPAQTACSSATAAPTTPTASNR